MVKKYIKYNKCKCGNKKIKESKQCKKCHMKKGYRVSQQLNQQSKLKGGKNDR